MYKHILIATDGSDLSDKALQHGLALAKPLGATVTVATTTEPWDAVIVGEVAVVLPVERYEETATANAEAILSRAQAAAGLAGVAVETQHVTDAATDGSGEETTENEEE
jgi:nucleotide-binding universal stress UspA family protein